MKVTVRTFGAFRDLAGRKTEVEVGEGATVAVLMELLFRHYPGLEDEIFASPGTLKRQVNLLLNGRNIEFTGGLDRVLAEGDILALFPPAEGG